MDNTKLKHEEMNLMQCFRNWTQQLVWLVQS